MCWSWEVSFSFFLIDFIGLLYIFYRNEYIDRYWVLIISPIAVQEFCQFVLWKFGIDSDTTANHCNTVNKTYHLIILLSINLLPLFIAIVSYRTTSALNNVTKLIQNMFWEFLIFFEIVAYAGCIYMNVYGTPALECIFAGVNGHQVWWDDEYNPAFEIVVMTVYLLPSIFSCVLYQPLWVSFVPNFYGISSLFVFRFMIGLEAYSVWCWAATFWVLWAFCYVYIAKAMVKYKLINVKSVAYLHLVSFNVISGDDKF
eukprot:52542_1